MATAQTQTNGIFKTLQHHDNMRVTETDWNQIGELSIADMAELLRNTYGINAQIIYGLDVSESSTPGMKVDIAKGMAKSNDTGVLFRTLTDGTFEDVDTSTWEIDGLPILLDTAIADLDVDPSHPTDDRIDIVEIRLTESDSDTESRDIIDPVTKVVSSQSKDTRKQLAVEAKVKTGTPAGSPVAPAVDDGWVKIAEIEVGAAVTEIYNASINNVTARFSTESNTAWTTEASATFKSANMQTHRESATIDHPDGSVTWAKLDSFVRNSITGGSLAEVFWGKIRWQSTSSIVIFPDPTFGVIRAVFKDGSILDSSTPLTVSVASATQRLDGLAQQTDSWYSIIFYKDSSTGNLAAGLWLMPSDTIASVTATGTINLNGTNAYAFRKDMEVVLWKDSNNFDAPYFNNASGTGTYTVNDSNKLRVESAPTSNNVVKLYDRSGGIGINTTYSGSDIIYPVSGFKPVDYASGNYPSAFNSSEEWCDTGWRIRTNATGSGEIIPFVIIGDEFYYVNGTGSADYTLLTGIEKITIPTGGVIARINYAPVDSIPLILTRTEDAEAILSKPYWETYYEVVNYGNRSNNILKGMARIKHGLFAGKSTSPLPSLLIRGYKRSITS